MLFNRNYLDYVNERIINLIPIIVFIMLIILIIAISNTYPSFGPPGPDGQIGSKGFDGIQGQRGHIGWYNDYINKNEDNIRFSISEGPQGEKGPIGKRGIIGEQGPIGDPGEIGPFGDQGINGMKGIKGVQGDKGDSGPIIPEYYLKYTCGNMRDWPVVIGEKEETVSTIDPVTNVLVEKKIKKTSLVPDSEAVCNPMTPFMKQINKKFKRYQCCSAMIVNNND